jgi:hypothetical protein
MGSKKKNPDPGVNVAVAALDLLGWVMLYEILWTIPWVRSDKVKKKFAYGYVAFFAGVLAIILVTSGRWTGSGWAWIFVIGIPAYRLLDIFRWWASLLLDKRHFQMVSAQRLLLFAFANLGETALIAAIWLRATNLAHARGEAWFQSFSLVTQLDRPLATTTWQIVAVVLTEITALLLLLGGIATIIALVPKRLRETGEHESYSKWALFFAATVRPLFARLRGGLR